ncbi:MAG: hypothetical protein KGI08_10965 [Thaumarchaeota archaeon]|nr:hypothetical protein [Nitrososphaerota archaeon]
MFKCRGTDDYGCYWAINETEIASMTKEELEKVLVDHWNTHVKKLTPEQIIKLHFERIIPGS